MTARAIRRTPEARTNRELHSQKKRFGSRRSSKPQGNPLNDTARTAAWTGRILVQLEVQVSVMYRSNGVIRGFLLLIVAIATSFAGLTAHAADQRVPFRILHVMSYHADWEWNQDQLRGFKDALDGIDVEYRIIEMDTKRQSSEHAKRKVSAKARTVIDEWTPDLVYTNDDNAQQYVAKDYIGTDLPFVFSGVNADPATYGFVGSPNVTGVLEIEHSLQTVRLLRQIAPNTRRIAVIVDEGSTWPGVIKRLRATLRDEPAVELVSVDTVGTFAEYKAKILDYQDKVDALGILGVFTFEDEAGRHVAYQDVLRWTAENSTLPDFSFWGDRVELGTLVAVRVSGYSQGRAAGEKARTILADGRKAGELPMEPTIKGEPVVSLARARSLGLKIPSTLLLNAKVVKDYRWNI